MADSHVRRDLIGIGVLVLGTILAGVLSSGSHATSDATLRKRFSEHREAFDSLATMAIADTQLVGLGPTAVFVRDTPTRSRALTEPEVSASGRARFRALLQLAGLPALSRERNGEAIWFVVRTHDGTRKGYVHSRAPREPVLGSLDDSPQYGYVALAPGWFLFLQPESSPAVP
jgi:hypothetical protein